MFPNINRTFQLLQDWLKYPRRQAALIRKIVDRIRNSLELQVVLQTAVDEVAALLELDGCKFLWYFKDTQRVQVVCEHNNDSRKESHLGYHPLESFGAIAQAIAAGDLITNSGTVRDNPLSWGLIGEQLPWFWHSLPQRRKQSDDADANHKLFGYSASLMIPVSDKESSIGFIACLCEQPRTWSVAEIEFLEVIAEPLEIAIRQARLYEQTQKQAICEQLINQITSQTRQSFDPETILTEAIAQLLEAMQADRCLVHQVEEASEISQEESQEESQTPQSPVPPVSSGTAFRCKHLYEVCREPFLPTVDNFDIHGPITQWVIQHRQLVTIPDIEQDERIGKANIEYQKAQIKSSLVIPVQANGTLHALLYLNQCSHVRYWSKNDQKLAQAVADQLAISLQQAHLYARTQQQAQKSEMQAQEMSEMLEQLRLTQVQLIQSEKMSSLGRMVAGVAHEINNPINFIYGNIPYVDNYVSALIRLVEAYQAHYTDPPAQLQKLTEETEIDFLLRDLPKILKSMQLGAERIHEIVQLLQKFSGNNAATLKWIDLNAALESTLLILHNQMTGIKVERHYDNLPHVQCYPKPINQAFLSIITNAIEALNRWSDPNKTLTLRTEWLPSSEMADEGRVRIAIADNGPGIQPDIQPKIFEPFFTTKEVGQGRGLGLTISYQTIVNQHNGQLEVISQPGQGTQFLIEIPLRHPKPLTSNSSPQQPMSAVSPAKSPVPNPGW